MEARLVATCDYCTKTFPRRMIVAAHKKRRQYADATERRDLKNIMLNCTQCDHLYEHGHISIGHDGRVLAEPRPETSDLASLVNALAGRQCPAHDAGSEQYFSWHRDQRLRR